MGTKQGVVKTDLAMLARADIKANKAVSLAGYEAVRTGIVDLVQAARTQAARSVNALMTASYWEIGRRIVEAEQMGRRRAGYGDVLIKRLGVDLTAQFGRGFGWRNLFQMRSFYLGWPQILQTASAIPDESEIVQTLSATSVPLHPAPRQLDEIARHFSLP